MTNHDAVPYPPHISHTTSPHTHLPHPLARQLGLIIAIGLAGGHLAIGTLLLFVNARRVYPYVLELAMLCIYAPLLGVSLASDGGAQNIQRNYNFIVHSALAGVTLVGAGAGPLGGWGGRRCVDIALRTTGAGWLEELGGGWHAGECKG
eukprot:358777-Chlamydomonas_euryale.AAC.6